MAAPMWNSAVENFVNGENESTKSAVGKALLAKEVELLEVIEFFGQYLTSTDTTVRVRCIQLLADTLSFLPSDFLSGKEVLLLTSFLCEKLSDHHSVQPPVLHALLALSSATDLPEGVAEQTCRQIFRDVQTQSLAQGDRRSVYVIFSNLLYKKLTELQKMEGDFVCGFIQAMDAERDPRNLVICFQLALTIIQNFPLGVFVEEMFEVTSCYFPVDFNPSSKDPGAVKKEDLIVGVRRCMTATPKFGQYCLPLIIEKLTSDVQNAKIDSLDTLAVGCDVYGSECLNEYTSSLFSCIKREVYSGASEQLTTSALSALTAIVTTLSQGVTERDSKSTYLSEFLKDVFRECKRHLTEPDLRLISPSCDILQATARGSDSACWFVLDLALPVLMEQYATRTQGNQRKPVVDSLRGFMEVTSTFNFNDNAPSPLKDYKSTLQEILASALKDNMPSLRVAAIQGQTTLVSLPGVLTETEVAGIGDLAVKHLLTDSDADVRRECICVLKMVAKRDVDFMKNSVLSQITAKLNSEPMETDMSSKQYNPSPADILTVLTSLSCHVSLVDVTVTHLVSFLSNNTNSLNVKAAQCLAQLANENKEYAAIMDYIYETVIPKLLAVLVQSYVGPGDSDLPCEELLGELSKVFRYITVSLDRRKAEDLMTTMYQLFVKGDTTVIKNSQCPKFCPLQASSPVCQTRLLVILQAVLCSLPRQVMITDVTSLLESLASLSLDSSDKHTCCAAMKCYAGILNKLPTESLDSIIKRTQETLTKRLDLSPSDQDHSSVLDLWIWVTKAMVLRCHSSSTSFVKKLILLLKDKSLGLQAANGFLTVVTEFDDVMSTDMSAHVSMFYRQKLFVDDITDLIDKFKSAGDERPHYLLAISHLIKHLPQQVLLTEISALMPILVQSLQCGETTLLVSTLCKMSTLTRQAPDIIAKDVDTIIPQLLKLTAESQNMKVRMHALQSLNALTVLPTHVTLPHKVKVTRSLQGVLDDKKRLVRKEAVVTRGNWYLIGEPGK